MKHILATILAAFTLAASAEMPVRLMHEMRATPSPAPGGMVDGRFASLQWPLAEDCPYMNVSKSRKYKVRYSTDRAMKNGVVEIDTKWPFVNITNLAAADSVFWQHAYVTKDGTSWSPVFSFALKNHGNFCPPAFEDLIKAVPKAHPRVYIANNNIDALRARSAGSPDAEYIISRADKALTSKMKTPEDIKTGMADKISNQAQKEQMIVRESRRVIDKAENDVDALIKAYIITGDTKYADAAIGRVEAIMGWTDNPKIAGDFNAATFMAIFSQAYDLLADRLNDRQKKSLMQCIAQAGTRMYNGFSNYLENHIAENHIWQITLRIFTMSAFTAYGHIPEAEEWCDYAYNVWLARFPGLNADGAWHNGDSYCNVNIRTLIEVPYFYSRISGFDFFSDPWYQGNVLYTIYNQPPGSHSGGNGSAHIEKTTPQGTRIGYADALAKLTGNTFAADYVRKCTAKQPKIMQKGCLDKGGGLAWWRLQHGGELPEGPGLEALASAHIFPQSGLALFHSNLAATPRNAMLSFRSSPYGSTSHALANQNAFNTFFGGEPLFYSTGHHTSFIDRHALLCERSTRAHNSILVNGMGQRIGVEGYGWMPRHYVGESISYVVGDASNAYGPVISNNWEKRAKGVGIELSAENGWDEVGLKTFRRHIVNLEEAGIAFIYDELEAEGSREWSYLLHTVTNPMDIDFDNNNFIRVSAVGNKGVSDAFIFSGTDMECDTTSRFFAPADNWLKADADGNFAKYPNHYHFTARTTPERVCRIASIINTHRHPKEGAKTPQPVVRKDGSIKMREWIIELNLTSEGNPFFSIRSTKEGQDATIRYDGGNTVISENGRAVELADELPSLEI